jgi:hypothetical protein
MEVFIGFTQRAAPVVVAERVELCGIAAKKILSLFRQTPPTEILA